LNSPQRALDAQAERELAYYRRECNDLGARLLRLQEEQSAAFREARRSRTVAKLIREAHHATDVFETLAELGSAVLEVIVENALCDRAALLERQDGPGPGIRFRVTHAVGFDRVPVPDSVVLPSLPEFFLTTSRTSIEPPAFDLTAILQVPYILWAADRRTGHALIIGNQSEGNLSRPFEAGDQELIDGALSVYIDVLRRKRAEQELRASEQRYRLIIESARDYAIFATDLKGCVTSWNRGAQEVLGWKESEILGQPYSMVYTPEERAKAAPAADLAEALAAGHSRHQRAYLRADGTRLWGTSVITPLRDTPSSAGQGLLVIVRDHTEQRLAERRQQILVEELQHRTRNLLAVVSAIAHGTEEGSSSLGDFGPRFRSRLAALARVQHLLSPEGGAAMSIGGLVTGELLAHGVEPDGHRVSVTGPEVVLPGQMVQTLTLALHELATNAVKHGALRGADEGRLAVSWSVEVADGNPPLLTLEWKESGVVMPPSDRIVPRGYGRELIEGALPYELGARTDFSLESDGIRCRICLAVGHAIGESPEMV
jgi:PAS domain S-box-containing protein